MTITMWHVMYDMSMATIRNRGQWGCGRHRGLLRQLEHTLPKISWQPQKDTPRHEAGR